MALPASAAPLSALEANMTGKKEVPGDGDRNGKGSAEVEVFRSKVCYTLTVERIRPATAAHIHEGRRGVAGGIVVELKPPRDGSSRGCEDISRALSRDLREHPRAFYVNVHNNQFPDGAVRGQLHR
jgi:CHRD domain